MFHTLIHLLEIFLFHICHLYIAYLLASQECMWSVYGLKRHLLPVVFFVVFCIAVQFLWMISSATFCDSLQFKYLAFLIRMFDGNVYTQIFLSACTCEDAM